MSLAFLVLNCVLMSWQDDHCAARPAVLLRCFTTLAYPLLHHLSYHLSAELLGGLAVHLPHINNIHLLGHPVCRKSFCLVLLLLSSLARGTERKDI